MESHMGWEHDWCTDFYLKYFVQWLYKAVHDRWALIETVKFVVTFMQQEQRSILAVCQIVSRIWMNKTGTHKKETCPYCECHKEHQIINGGSGYYILLVKHFIFFSGLESELLFHLLGRIEVWIIIWRFETQPRLAQSICVWNWILLCVKGLHLLWDLPFKEEPGLPPDWILVLEWRTWWRESARVWDFVSVNFWGKQRTLMISKPACKVGEMKK